MSARELLSTLRRQELLYVVFVTGAVVLAVEVMAVRILSPYFGNTIYTFSSVISVILAALAVGYWRGGRLADAQPEKEFFYKIVTRSGIAVLALYAFHSVILYITSSTFSLLVGPLISACILFFVPSYYFGLLSPFVIKLQCVAAPNRGVGAISGEVFFVSTVGSIVGSLLSGFVLIPHVGITVSMVSMGLCVVVIGVMGVWASSGMSSLRYLGKKLVLAAVLVYPAVSFGAGSVVTNGTILYAKDGVYERVTVVDVPQEDGNVARLLYQDRSLSSGIKLPEGSMYFKYAPYYQLYNLFSPTLQRALVLGAGTGVLPRELHKQYPEAIIDMVDIEPVLFYLAKEYFMVPDTPKIVAHHADGRQFLHDKEEVYDLIFGDIYSTYFTPPWHVSTKEYYALIWDGLREGGVYIGNYLGMLNESSPSFIGSTVRTIEEVFGSVRVFAVESKEFTEVQNIIVVAVRGASESELASATTSMSTTTNATLQTLLEHEVVLQNCDSHMLFTDNKAPVELYAARMLRK